MKINIVIFGTLLIVMGFSSCKDETEEKAQKRIISFEKYVDSINNIAEAEVKSNWDGIRIVFDKKTLEVEMALNDIKYKAKIQEKINFTKAKFAEYKTNFEVKFLEEKEKLAKDGG